MEVSEHALAFYICATRLLKTKRDDDGIPILPSNDDQLRVIIVGVAVVGKSHVLRSLMWFAYQHGSAVVASYYGRPVSNLRSWHAEMHVASNKRPCEQFKTY